jgi:hypothetical protein
VESDKESVYHCKGVPPQGVSLYNSLKVGLSLIYTGFRRKKEINSCILFNIHLTYNSIPAYHLYIRK